MNNHGRVPVVGEEIDENEWPKITEMIKAVEACGMNVIKILNYIDGSVKFIASIKDGRDLQESRSSLEKIGWKLLSPYTSHGKIVGFKVAKDREAKSNSAWGD